MAVDVDTADRQLSVEAADRDAADQATAQDTAAAGATPGDQQVSARPRTAVRTALIAGSAAVIALAGVAGWLGVRTYQSHQEQHQRNVFLQVGRQAALNLTTIRYTDVDADIDRILDSATGEFHDDFQQRSGPFMEVVKRAQTTSEGTVTEAGLESFDSDHAQVLVAVSVQTSDPRTADQQPRLWRMRIGVQKVDDGAKVSNVEFVA
ncbi:Mce protein [Mycolicibacter senuensis]|uniref:Mce protein n=1 Tax=Mycolicibacter senuensis TaxID=386913 RepID=UPI00256FC223|nr:Mce protein [Mycolicibacter senuensis]